MGINCCQAVLLAFSEELGLDEFFLLKLGSGFGNGMGGMQATCGALVGAGMAVSLMNGESDGSLPVGLKAKRMCEEFKARVGAIRCADIKGMGQTDPATGKVVRGKVLCSCDDCVRTAVAVASAVAADIAEEEMG